MWRYQILIYQYLSLKLSKKLISKIKKQEDLNHKRKQKETKELIFNIENSLLCSVIKKFSVFCESFVFFCGSIIYFGKVALISMQAIFDKFVITARYYYSFY
jgi:hypothetical protein